MRNINDGLQFINSEPSILMPQPAEVDPKRELRELFVKDILQQISLIAERTLPMGIKPSLVALLAACDHYIEEANEEAFEKQFQQTLSLTAKGWSSYSQWVAAEQITCYSLYCGLTVALEKHRQRQCPIEAVVPTQVAEPVKTPFLQKCQQIFKKVAYFFHNYDFEYYQWGKSFELLGREIDQGK